MYDSVQIICQRYRLCNFINSKTLRSQQNRDICGEIIESRRQIKLSSGDRKRRGMKIEKLGECPQLEQKEEGSQKSVHGQSISQYLFCWGNRQGRTRSSNWQFYVSHYEMEQFFLLPPDLCLVIVTSEQFRFVTHLHFSLSPSEISPHSSTCLFVVVFSSPISQ